MDRRLEKEFLISTRIVLPLSRDDLLSKHGLRHWDLGPLLQGLLMEHAGTACAGRMHGMPFNPYSQHCESGGDGIVWVVNALTDETYDSLVRPVLQASELRIKKIGAPFRIDGFQEARITRRSLADLIHGDNTSRFTLRFVTPTAFKSGGTYQTIPSTRLVYQNLIMHYGQVFDADHEVDPHTVEYLASHTLIARYSLHSCSFLVSGKRIPAFMGNMTVNVEGPQPLRGFTHMLFRFGEFGGVGIKTSMGMGGLSVG